MTIKEVIEVFGEFEFRQKSKFSAMYERGGAGMHCTCDLCGSKEATDYHEIVPRSKTNARGLSRLISYTPELCSILCRECHDRYHHREFSPETRNLLWLKNYDIFGRDRVQAAWTEFQSSLTEKIDWTLP